MQLNKSQVIFNQEEHTYSLNGVQLSGITGMIERQLFPDKYKDVPKFVMDRAAAKGSFVHEVCELVDELGVQHESIQAKNYLRIKEENMMVHEASEYLVSDNEHFASCIDKVYRVDDTTFDIGDIKTTYKLDEEYVSWQLSIYAYFFELQNPGAKVRNLFGIWLRDEKGMLVLVERKPTAMVVELLACEINGTRYNAPARLDTMPAIFSKMESTIADLLTQLDELEQKKKDLQEALMREMVKAGAYSWKGELISITRKKDTIRKSFDKARFEEDHPGLYDKYIKESPVVGSIMIKVNQHGKN